MTRQKSFKRGVRTRMAKTGESYTAARRQMLPTETQPDGPASTDEKPAAQQAAVDEATGEYGPSDSALRAATGRGWTEWFELLDGWDATSHRHGEIASWLVQEHGTGGWWSQSVTVGYERARGLRAKYQLAGGFSVGASKTIAADPDTAFDAFVDEAHRERWLPGVALPTRTSTRPRTARFDWPADGSRVVVGFTPTGVDRTQVALQHEKLPDAQAAEAMKLFWRERLSALKQALES
jgi:uncharacterized protein YndB with AHSA1/START domain